MENRSSSIQSYNSANESPSAYQLIKSSEYNGLTPVCNFVSKFQQFEIDQLYRYPILNSTHLSDGKV